MNISIIDDHILMAESLKRLLGQVDKTAEIKTYAGPAEFLCTDFNEWSPDIVITDLIMPDMTGLEMLAKVKSMLGADTKFILLTAMHDISTVKAALRNGVNCYITKDAAENEILDAFEAAKEGKRFMNKSVQGKLLSHMFMEVEEVPFHIAPREKEVLQRICDGGTPKEIAYDMQLSINTVQSYIKNLLRKFKVNRTADLVSLAKKKGIAKC